jgi:DNA invertase Pin-like site-specific DNA recombinase
MSEGKFISYLRVSTARQGRSGLGLEAQRKAVTDFLNGGNWTLVREFVELESGKRADRPRRRFRRVASLAQGSSLPSSTGYPEMPISSSG